LDAIDFPGVVSRLSDPDQGLQRAVDAYLTWLPLFKAAVAADGGTGVRA
jgi:hypothetical protein